MLIDDATPTTGGRDWRTPFIKYISDGTGFRDKTENERLIRRSKNYILVDGKLMRKNASSEVLLSAYPKTMVSSSWRTYTLDPVAITPHLERWSERLSEQVFIGQPRLATQKNWFGIAKDVSFSLRGPTYLPMKFKPSRRPGPLLAGGLT